MRKKILILLLFIVFMPVFVFADMGAPQIKPYDAVVFDVNGADYYEYFYEDNNNHGYRKVGVLKYDTVIRVTYETDINGELYANFEKDDEYYYILIKDIVPKDEEFIVDEKTLGNLLYKKDKIEEVLVLKSDGIKMHKGPAKVYSVVGDVIPKGTKLQYQYCAGDECLWQYVEYNGVKGWIETLDAVVGTYEKGNMIVAREIDLVYNDKVVGVIPGNTIINGFYRVDPWSWKYYVTYDGKSGYVDYEDVSILYVDYETLTSKKISKMYKYADLDSEVLVDNIPENHEFKFEYSLGRHGYEWIYVTYEGKSGWVYFDSTEDYMLNNQNDTNENENIGSNDNSVDVENNGDLRKPEYNENDDEVIKVDNSFSSKQIILLSIGIAVVISLTAVVTIVLINKKKK